MKKLAIIFFIGAFMLLSIGCFMIPPKPADAVPLEDTASTPPTESGNPQAVQETPAPSVDAVIEQAAKAETKYVPAEPEPTNVTNDTTPVVLKTSGSLALQSNKALCPRLASEFECDRYDIRRCNFKQIVGQNDFYPDIMSCRNGYGYRKEDPNHKYCFIQECRPLEKNNIVDAYGGPVAYAEYIYTVENVEGGIMTHYTLFNCGEDWQEFKTSSDCKFYLSEIKSI